jgi:4-hydroxybenzoate polyprenyltransferase
MLRDLTPWNFLAWAVVLFIAATLIVLFRAIVDDFADKRKARRAQQKALAELLEKTNAAREAATKTLIAETTAWVRVFISSPAPGPTEKPPDA